MVVIIIIIINLIPERNNRGEDGRHLYIKSNKRVLARLVGNAVTNQNNVGIEKEKHTCEHTKMSLLQQGGKP